MKKLTGHLEEKNGKWYAAVNHYTTDVKRKVKWYSLDLESRKGSKTEANHRLRALLEKLNTGTTSNIYSHLDAGSKLDSARAIGVALASGT